MNYWSFLTPATFFSAAEEGTSAYESNGKGKQVLEALAPQGETFKYAIDLKSMTQGRGYFEMEFDSYAEVPSSAAEKIVAGVRKDQ